MTMPTRRYDLLLFDFDGTLADSAVLFDLLLPALAQQRGVPPPAQGWHALRAMDCLRDQFFRRAARLLKHPDSRN